MSDNININDFLLRGNSAFGQAQATDNRPEQADNGRAINANAAANAVPANAGPQAATPAVIVDLTQPAAATAQATEAQPTRAALGAQIAQAAATFLAANAPDPATGRNSGVAAIPVGLEEGLAQAGTLQGAPFTPGLPSLIPNDDLPTFRLAGSFEGTALGTARGARRSSTAANRATRLGAGNLPTAPRAAAGAQQQFGPLARVQTRLTNPQAGSSTNLPGGGLGNFTAPGNVSPTNRLAGGANPGGTPALGPAARIADRFSGNIQLGGGNNLNAPAAFGPAARVADRFNGTIQPRGGNNLNAAAAPAIPEPPGLLELPNPDDPPVGGLAPPPEPLPAPEPAAAAVPEPPDVAAPPSPVEPPAGGLAAPAEPPPAPTPEPAEPIAAPTEPAAAAPAPAPEPPVPLAAPVAPAPADETGVRTTAATLADTELRNTTPLPPAAAPVPEAQDQAAAAPVVEATTTPLEITTPERLAGPDPIVPAPQGTGETTLPEPVAGPAEAAAPEETAPAPNDDAEPAVAPAPAEENAEQQRAAALLVELTNRARIAFEAQQQDSRTTGPGAGTNTNLSDQLIR